MKIEKLVSILNKGKRRLDDVRSIYEKIEAFVLPSTDTNIVSKADIHTSIGKTSLNAYANKIQSALIPPSHPWVELVMNDGDETNEVEANTLLKGITNTIFTHIKDSNFYGEVHKALLQLGISTGVLVVSRNDDPLSSSKLKFRSVPFLRTFIWEKHVAITLEVDEKFRKDNGLTSGEVVYQMVYVENSKYTMYTFTAGRILKEDKLTYNPFIVFRSAEVHNSGYGSGRVELIWENLLIINKLIKDRLKILGLKAFPVFHTTGEPLDASIQSIEPGMIIHTDENTTLNPLSVGGDINLMSNDIKEHMDIINEIMFAKGFGELQNTPVRTATEMSIRTQTIAEQALAHNTQIEQQLIVPLIKTVIAILSKEGAIVNKNGMPINLSKAPIKISMSSATRAMERKVQYNQVMEFTNSLKMFPPETIATDINISKVVKDLASSLDASHYLNTEEEKQVIINNIKQMRQVQQQQGGNPDGQ